ncbi:MAG: hypothetical protein ABIG84_00270 [archaeon]
MIDNPAKPTELLAAIRIYEIKFAKELKTIEELWENAEDFRSYQS